jgi:hypothetical protein
MLIIAGKMTILMLVGMIAVAICVIGISAMVTSQGARRMEYVTSENNTKGEEENKEG